MPLIPADFFVSLHPPHLSGQVQSKPRGLAFLSSPSDRNKKAGFSQAQLDEFSDLAIRAAVLANLVYAVARLHKHGLVYGDISLISAVFALDPPRVVLLDCDAVAPLSDSSRRQIHSPGFLPPECQEPGTHAFARGNAFFQDTRTDVYKLALCVIRGLSQGKGATQLKTTDHLRGVLPPAVLAVIDQALDPNPDRRPSAKELFEALANFVQAATRSPTINYFRPVTTVVPRGGDVVFLWDVENAKEAFLRGPNGFSTKVDPGRGQYGVEVKTSGTYTLEVLRRGASVSQPSEFIQVFDLPDFDITSSTVLSNLVPTIPAVAPVDINSVLEALPERPAVSIGSSFIPRIPNPSAVPLIRQLNALTGEVSPLEVVNRTIESYTPPALGWITDLGQVTGDLLAGGNALQDSFGIARHDLQESLQNATAATLADAIHRVNDGVTRKQQSVMP